MSNVRGYAQRIELSAPVARVWRALHDPVDLNVWLGSAAAVQPQVGGNYDVVLSSVVPRQGHIDVFEPERRLRVIYLTPPSMAPEKGTIIDDYMLSEQPGGSLLTLMADGIPQSPAWDHYFLALRRQTAIAMSRLSVLVSKAAG